MIIWIASYPKSGNTWVRSFLSSYIYKNAKSFNFSDLEKIRAFPSDLEINFLRKKYGKYKFTHMAEHWDIFQKNIINKNKYTFLKTHNALVNIKNFSFTNLNNTLGLIYIIRDPRDVAISYSSHLNLNLKDTINHMQNINLTEKTPDNLDRTLITSWSNHYNSWNLLPKKKIVIRYEDLIDKPGSSFLKILQYLNQIIPIHVDKKLITQTIELVNFNKLKLLESENGFIENKSPKKNHKFFKEGKKKQWVVNLPRNLQDKIKKMFEKEMFENKYIV
jgi:hypothetical protein